MTGEETTTSESREGLRTHLIELAEYHRSQFGDEEVEAEDWLDEADLDDPIRLAYLAEVMAEAKSLAALAEGVLKRRLSTVLDGGAVRSGDTVYVEGAGGGKWSATPDLWAWLVSSHVEDDEDAEVVARYLAAIVSGIRVTAIDKIAVESGLGSGDDDKEREEAAKQVVRHTFLNYKPGTPGLQRKDLRVENVKKNAAKWWPETDGQITYREETKDERDS